MNIFKSTISLLLLLVFGHIAIAQEECGTDPTGVDFLRTIPINQRVPSAATYVVRVYVHILRKDLNSNGGPSGQNMIEVNNALARLKTDFEPHNICISVVGIDEIYSTAYYNNATFYPNANGDGKFANFSPNSHANAIDLYFGGFNDCLYNAGWAAGKPSTALILGGNRYGRNVVNSPILTHEFGHCLGLFHTFHGICEVGCNEMDSTNIVACDTCGDFVCDTPPDPMTFSSIDSVTCSWDSTICQFGGGGIGARTAQFNWAPRTDLFMSYAPLNCRTTFTQGQGQRMRDMLSNSPILQQVIVPDDLIFTNFSTTIGQELLYDVRNSITAENSVFVNPSSKLTYRAGHYILLDPGFEVNNGGFEATINTVCSTIDFNNSARSSDSKKNIELDRIDEMSFEVYPNPNNGIFTIESKELTSSIIDVYDLLGQKVKSIQISSTKTLIDLSNFPKGVYLLIYTDKNKKSNKRIILE